MTRETASRESYWLRRLARFSGIETGYRDAGGGDHEASDAGLFATLRALDCPIERMSDARVSLQTLEGEHWSRGCDPVAVVWEGDPARIELRLPAGARGTVSCYLRLENEGLTQVWHSPLAALPVIGRRRLSGETFVARRWTLEPLPPGYHRLYIEGAGFNCEMLLLSAPRRAYEPAGGKRRGVFVPVYALHSARSWGSGDFTDLSAFAAAAAIHGTDLVATLPVLPAFLDEPFSSSPYSPVSRLFWNELFIDPEAAPGFGSCPEAQAAIASPDFQRELAELRTLALVDYRRAMALKRRVLAPLAEHAFEHERAWIDAYLNLKPEAADYARFRATTERQRRSWWVWPERQRQGNLRPGDYDEAAFRYHVYVQALAEAQLEDLSRGLRDRGQDFYLDLPLGVNSDGYDRWRFRDLFAAASVGAPPDPIFTGGQDWGLPPLQPQRLRETGYAYLRAVLGHHLAHASVLRIDHVMGLHRLFWVPYGAPASEGVYVRYAADELYAILCIESHRHEATIVGENLGTVPPAVDAALSRHGVYKSYVVQYDLAGEDPAGLQTPPGRSFASVNTHDMPPFAGYLSGADLGERVRIGQVTPGALAAEKAARERQRANLVAFLQREGLLAEGDEDAAAVYAATLRYLRRSSARISVANLEDLWLETESQNLPGTVDEHPNWRRRARYAVEDLPAAIETLLSGD